MKTKVKNILLIFFITIIGGWLLSKIPFNTKIDQTIMAEIFIDGAAVEETSVYINGARSNYLFAGEQYYEGLFIFEYYEGTGREGMKANIKWNKEFEEQRILYYQYATFPSLEINHELLINKEMDEFAVGFEDGTIIATSEEIYQYFMKNINPVK